ncbi:N-acetylglucosamine-6-phosphate deacetylase [Parapedobacter sp. ISTM3]|uniref:N-acetylglucosamine-6-phosphate deacetylase n=1 Tax=Parapedobacter sp. ISTM3 TaxID=2800130 RepID=UPI00190510BD|nr:N-acetylglucosamine-6-phosphate deacetylase [Parapedobacter sp. ISTM3]MBK1442382.1 N-acetylglucosamine-6-phosphate deacetylase [Parapedobacter sp. ISTM3]
MEFGKPIKIINARAITPQRIIDHCCLVIQNGKIRDMEPGSIDTPDAEVIDVEGRYVAPGFIDLHIHGGGGHDFMDNTVEAYLAIAEIHARYGTTAMCPTTLTAEKEDLLKTLGVYDQANRLNTRGAQFLGLHLEGPYFALDQRGAQDPKYIRDPDPDEYREILASSPHIRRWSAAPELPGALEFGRYLRTQGVLAAVAHTDAIYEDVVAAVENGYTLTTHLYSGMSGVTRRACFRYAGVIEAAYLLDEMDVEIIADGVHLPAPLLRMVHKFKGPHRTALITDAMRGAGMPPGESVLGNHQTGLHVIIEDGVAKLPDRSSFAGSVATADRLIRNMVHLAGVPLAEAVQMMTATPARILGIQDRKGTLAIGMDADLAVFDDRINIAATWVNGSPIFLASHQS